MIDEKIQEQELTEEQQEETLQESVKDPQYQQQLNDKLAAFLAETKERFDKYFNHLGYVCFVFDKSNPQNSYIANISNVTVKGYLKKLLPYLAKYRHALKKLNKNKDRRFRRVK